MARRTRRKAVSRLTIAAGFAALACAHAIAAGPDKTSAAQGGLLGQLGALEGRSYAAWKSGDTTFWPGFLSAKFIGWGPAGRLDRTTAQSALSGAGCAIASYTLSHEEVTRITPDVAVLTHRTDVDGVCGARTLAPASYTASGYVREAGRWKLAFRAQSAIVDPATATKPPAGGIWTGGPTARDAATLALLPREQAVWTHWMHHDARRLDPPLAADVQFIDLFGHHLATRAEALKTWTGEGCHVKSFELAGARATMLTDDVGVITQRASADGECFGQAVWPIWGSSFYVKRGRRWLWSFGINVLAGTG